VDQNSWDTSITTALSLDQSDPLSQYRSQFHIPGPKDKPWTYLCGNSLGLQLKSVESASRKELSRWKELGVEGWFEGDRPWLPYHEYLSQSMAKLVGAKTSEVIVMNTLTVNLHLLMASFYKPVGNKTKILMEKDAFPSDHHMVMSQLQWHGLDPQDHIIYAYPDERELTSDGSICALIEAHKDSLAMVLLGGVNYLTGQAFDIGRIASSCRTNDVIIGVDLAHAVGNVKLDLNEWKVDFAAWCTYKYLNSGPGGPGGAFVHEQHTSNRNLMPRLAGWWGHEEATRFMMRDHHIPMSGAAGWQISTPQVMNYVALSESLKLFDQVGIEQIDEKRRKMNQYFDFLIQDLQAQGKGIEMVSPRTIHRRGAQFSIRIRENGRTVFEALKRRGIICDWRSPDMIRISPAPLYNRFSELYHVYTTFLEIV